jgi:hypothetical protein
MQANSVAKGSTTGPRSCVAVGAGKLAGGGTGVLVGAGASVGGAAVVVAGGGAVVAGAPEVGGLLGPVSVELVLPLLVGSGAGVPGPAG